MTCNDIYIVASIIFSDPVLILNKRQPPPGFEPTTFDLGNALKIFAKSRNLAEFTSGSAKFRKFAYQIRMFAY